MTQSLAGVRAALLAACETLFADSRDTGEAPVLVTLGTPGSYQPDYIVAVAVDTRQPRTRMAFGLGERTAEVDTIFSTYVPGDEAATTTAAIAADDLVDLLEAWVAGNKELGGACMDATVTNIAGPSLVAVEHPETHAVTGRLATCVVTITARIVN